MKNKMLNIFNSTTLWEQVLSGIIVTAISFIFIWIWGLIKGLDIEESIIWLWHIMSIKVSLIFFWVLILALIVYFRWNNKRLSLKSYTKSEIDLKLNNLVTKIELETKLNCTASKFNYDWLWRKYHITKIKNHPYHELYISDDLKDLVMMLNKAFLDKFEIDEAIRGLISEIKANGISETEAHDLINTLNSNEIPPHCISQKEELLKILNNSEK